MQVAIQPCCHRDHPDVILRIVPVMPEPIPRRSHEVHLPVSSFVSSAFPMWKRGSAPSFVRERDFLRAAFRGCSYFVMLPGRNEARTGLRMMPTSPRPPLKSRTVSFPQYGFKAGMSDGPSRRPRDLRVVRFASVLRAHRLPRLIPVLSRGTRRAWAPPFEGDCRSTPGALARVIVSRSILAYSTPCAPLAGTTRFRRTAVYTRCPRCASLPSTPRRPASGSVLSLVILYRHVAL
jgi:hypothetical protein